MANGSRHASDETGRLRAQVAALEQLLAVHEQTVLEQSTRLREALERLQQAASIVERSPIVVFRLRAEEGWPVVYVTKNVTQFGYTDEELLTRKVLYRSLVHPDDLAQITQQAQHFCERGIDSFQQEYRLLTKSKAVRWVDDRCIAERDSSGRITHYQGILLDITARKEAEQALSLKIAELEQLNQLMMGREDRILELKQEVNALLEELRRSTRYGV